MSVKRRQLIKTSSYYKAPELCLGGVLSFPVRLWACGCVLEELAHRRIIFRGESIRAVLFNIFIRLGAPQPPRVLTRLHLFYDADMLPPFKPVKILRSTFDAALVGAAAASRPASFRALVRGLLQLAPDERMTRRSSMGHLFAATELVPIVSEAAGDRGRVPLCRASWSHNSCSCCKRIHIGRCNALKDQHVL